MSDRLKPCPFCGGEAYFAPVGNGIWCKGCEVEMHNRPDGIPSHEENWNRRQIIEGVEDAFKDAYNEHGAQGYGRDKLSQHAVTEALAELEGKIMFLLNSAHLTAGATHDR